VHYTILAKNEANSSVAARIADDIPGGMRLVGSSIKPYSYDDNFIHWVFEEIKPGEHVVIEYVLQASRNGAYVNKAHLEASSADGSGSATADAEAYIEVRKNGIPSRTVRYGGWQPPEWNMTSPDSGLGLELMASESADEELSV
jgi:hypothetical protein